jgi:hypothetical protein
MSESLFIYSLIKFARIRRKPQAEKELEIGDPGRTRTCNPLLRRQVLYPVELRDRLEGRK